MSDLETLMIMVLSLSPYIPITLIGKYKKWERPKEQ